jgi:hypothetical protein
LLKGLKKFEHPVAGLSAHRTQIVKVEDGFLVVDKSCWYTSQK